MILTIIFWIIGVLATAYGHVLIWKRMPSTYSKVNKLALMFLFTIIYCLLLLGLAYAFTEILNWRFASAALASGFTWVAGCAVAVNIKRPKKIERSPE